MGVQLTLEVYKNDALLVSRDFDRDIIKIGRLASAHLCLEDEKVSRIHSVIEVSSEGGMSIIDMGSVEGTFVNGKRVNKGALSFGDEIKIGATTIKVIETAAKNLAAAAAAAAPEQTPIAPAQDAGQALAQAAQFEAPAEVQAAAPAPVFAPADDALDPSFASTQKNPVLAPVAAAKHERIEVARARPQQGKKLSGPVGLSVRVMWGDQMLAEHLLRSDKGKGAFTVGTSPNVDVVVGDGKFSGPEFDVVRVDGNGFALGFTGKMKGELHRRGQVYDLKQAIELGKASHDGDGYALPLEEQDFAWVDLGGITVEVMFKAVPKPVFVPFGDTVDFFALNIFLVVLCLGAFFVVSAAIQKEEGAAFDDELSDDQARIAKLIFKPAETKKNELLQRLEERKQEKASGEAAQKHKGDEGKTGKKDAPKTNARMAPQGKPDKKEAAQNLLKGVFGGKGTSTVFDKNDVGGALKSMTGGLFGAKPGDSLGLGGKGLKGGGGGGGGDGHTIGISGVATSGRGGGTGDYGNAVGVLGGKKGVDIGITSSEPMVQGSLDKELIRKVIRSHVDQVRFCYESQLQRFPKLSGKTAIKFVITANGTVASSSVAQSTTDNSALDNCVATKVRTWLFPKPKGGGVVVVTYPFLFKQSGE